MKKNSFSHIVISPGPGNPTDPQYFGICSDVILTFGEIIPILGVCLGHQGIIACFGGKIIRCGEIKHGKKSLITHIGRGIFKNVKSPLYGMRYHSLIGEKESIPAILQITATTVDSEIIMGVEHKKYPIFGIQFHPESIGTEEGKKILENFLNY